MACIGLDSFSYHLHLQDVDHPRDAFWFLGKVLELQLDGCSFNAAHLRGWDEDMIHAIGAFCDQHGLYLEITSNASDYARLCRRLILASEVGARMLRTFIAFPEVSEEQRRVHIRFAVENLKRLGEVAECVGVVLGIGNQPNLTTTELVDILHQVNSPFVRVSFCSAEVLGAWEDPVEAAVGLAPYITAVTLKDWRVWREGGATIHEGCVLGEGQARVADVHRILSQICPKAPITLEIPTLGPGHTLHALEEEEAHVRRSVEYAKALDQERVLIG